MDEPLDKDLQVRELEIVTYLLRIFQDIPLGSRKRVIDTVARFFDLWVEHPRSPSSSFSVPAVANIPELLPLSPSSFSEDRSITPKQFMFQKQPRTDVEKIACLAYYLTHYRDTPFFRTLDISKLNTEAAQVKFSNPAVSVENASKMRYLVPATKGNKQLGALGEQFVLALPDREKAKEVMSHVRTARRTKKTARGLSNMRPRSPFDVPSIPLRIVVFNHKGGVGKTTLTVNLAAALASLGLRVLLVYSDPQCNLTAYLVEDAVVDDLLDRSDSDQGQTVWSAVKPVSEGVGDFRNVGALERLPNVFLLPGDVRLAEFEQELGPAWNESFQRKARGLRNTTALSQLVQQTAQSLSIDIVFYDAGPNIGPLNRVILLDCDYFIVPVACDLFSIRALKTLGHTLVSWIRDWQTILDLVPTGMYLLPGSPRFLGYMPQRFKTYGGDVSSSYAKYLPKIERSVQSDLVTVLGRLDPRLVAAAEGDYELGQIKDFGTVANASQLEGVPIKDVKAGNPSQRIEAESAFLALAKALLMRTGLNGR